MGFPYSNSKAAAASVEYAKYFLLSPSASGASPHQDFIIVIERYQFFHLPTYSINLFPKNKMNIERFAHKQLVCDIGSSKIFEFEFSKSFVMIFLLDQK